MDLKEEISPHYIAKYMIGEGWAIHISLCPKNANDSMETGRRGSHRATDWFPSHSPPAYKQAALRAPRVSSMNHLFYLAQLV